MITNSIRCFTMSNKYIPITSPNALYPIPYLDMIYNGTVVCPNKLIRCMYRSYMVVLDKKYYINFYRKGGMDDTLLGIKVYSYYTGNKDIEWLILNHCLLYRSIKIIEAPKPSGIIIACGQQLNDKEFKQMSIELGIDTDYNFSYYIRKACSLAPNNSKFYYKYPKHQIVLRALWKYSYLYDRKGYYEKYMPINKENIYRFGGLKIRREGLWRKSTIS